MPPVVILLFLCFATKIQLPYSRIKNTMALLLNTENAGHLIICLTVAFKEALNMVIAIQNAQCHYLPSAV